MMRPPLLMCGSAAWTQFSGPIVLISKTCRKSSRRSSATRPESPSPALLTRMSRVPNASTLSPTNASTEPLFETLVFTASTLSPEAEISLSRASSFSAARAASTTTAPRDANSRAVASPIPPEAPVTTATLPLRVCFTTLAILARIRRRGSLSLEETPPVSKRSVAAVPHAEILVAGAQVLKRLISCAPRFQLRALYTNHVAKVLVGVTGGIAAYKAPGVIRRLREAGHEVRVIATGAAFRFVPEETLAIAAAGGIHTDETWWERSGRVRSEERRVGKECRSRWSPY